jgi:HD-like signal output (HDOD) protein
MAKTELDLLARTRADLRQRIDRGTLELPLLPGVAHELAAICATAETAVRDLVPVIQRDPALAGHLLRVANSPLYRPVEPIVTLQQAVSRLGSRKLVEIAFALAVHGQVFSLRAHRELVERIWRSSVATAQYAREIARLRRRHVESAFLCGLLHQIGKPVVLGALATLATRGSGADEPALDAAQIDQIATEFHREVGGRAAELWKLPPLVTATIRGDDGAREMQQLLALAREFADATLDGGDTPAGDDAMAAAARLNLYPEDLERIAALRAQVLAAVAAIA